MAKKTKSMPVYNFKKPALYALKIHYIHVKKNWFGQIKEVILIPEDKDYDPINVSAEYYNYFKPEVGGYFVRTCMENFYINEFWFRNETEFVFKQKD